jgi:ParB family chromosome partitioning protein
MRHDAHYVDELSAHRPAPVGRLIAVDKLDPNPEQPRVEIGDLTELVASVSENGVLEPLLVKPLKMLGRWMIIAGERRWRAAREAGLAEVPCIEMDVDDHAVAEIALIENLQRKDLTIWEEADGLLSLCNRFGYTHEEVARKMGKSRATVTESLSIAKLPDSVRAQCRQAEITSKSLLLQIVRQPDDETMQKLVDEITSQGLTREEARESRRSQGTATTLSEASRPFVFHFAAPNKEFRMDLRFRRSKVERSEIATALREIADKLDAEERSSQEATNQEAIEHDAAESPVD